MQQLNSYLIYTAYCEEVGISIALRYSSFDGGGYQYNVEISDESLLSAKISYDYGDQSIEAETGSAFDVIITLTGRAPGETELVVFWDSPILPPGVAHYTAVIAEDLTITLEEEPYMRVNISEEFFAVRLEQNETAAAFAALLPLELNMEQLNGNEIYHYLASPLPSAPKRVGHVNAGDIMLFGDSCVVIFYKSFDTPYSYTRIGSIDDAERLTGAIGGQDALVMFDLQEN